MDYATLRDLLDKKGVSWKYYSPPVKGSTGSLWNAFDAIRAVRYGSEWGTNVTFNNKQIFDDIAGRYAAGGFMVRSRPQRLRSPGYPR